MPALMAVSVRELSHSYGKVAALDRVSFEVPAGTIFGVVGPNGGGKSTLFRVLSTLAAPQSGDVFLLGHDLRRARSAVRAVMGVTFQSPSLDDRLTVEENLRHQGHLHGLQGRDLRCRIDAWLDRMGVSDRRRDRVASLSGGLARRVEIAKSMLHAPRLLLLDEPTTGLDPGARSALWSTLEHLRSEGVTVLLTTHLMPEAEQCDLVAILNQGRLAALGRPADLRAEVGGECLTLTSADPAELARVLVDRFAIKPQIIQGVVRIESAAAAELLVDILRECGAQITSALISKPSLEDVFIRRTGELFEREGGHAA